MFTKSSIAITVVITLMLPALAFAQAAPCMVAPPAAGIERIRIDARNGQVLEGEPRYKRTSRVEVVLENKNPFRFTYTLDATEVKIGEPGLAAFLPFIAPFTLDAAPATPAGGETPPSNNAADAAEAAALAQKCPVAAALRERHEELRTDREQLDTALATAASNLKVLSDAYTNAKITLDNATATCQSLHSTATAILARLNTLSGIDLDALTKAIDELEDKAETQTAELRAYRTRKDARADCPSISAPDLAAMADRAELLSDAVIDKLRANIAKLQTSKQTLETARASIKTILDAGALPFTQVLLLGPYDDATRVTLKLDRKENKADAQVATLSQTKIDFGGPAFFTLGGGLAASSINRVQYERVQGFAVDPETNEVGDELTNIVGEKENSSARVTPLLILHGRLGQFSPGGFPFSVQASLGVSAKVDNLGVDVEYLAGPSFGFLDNQLFVTVGAYGGRVQELQGGLKVGHAVPEELTEIPVRKDLVWRLGFAVTYKLR